MCLVSVLDQGMRQTVPLVLWIPPEASRTACAVRLAPARMTECCCRPRLRRRLGGEDDGKKIQAGFPSKLENDGAGRRKQPVWFPAPLSFGPPEGAGTRRRCGPLGAGVKRRSRRRAVILVTLVITAIGCDD